MGVLLLWAQAMLLLSAAGCRSDAPVRPGPDQAARLAVAPNLLASEEVRIDFQLDKFLPPVGQDERHLGVVVTSIGLEPQ